MEKAIGIFTGTVFSSDEKTISGYTIFRVLQQFIQRFFFWQRCFPRFAVHSLKCNPCLPKSLLPPPPPPPLSNVSWLSKKACRAFFLWESLSRRGSTRRRMKLANGLWQLATDNLPQILQSPYFYSISRCCAHGGTYLEPIFPPEAFFALKIGIRWA